MGENSRVGAGSVVLSDVPPNSTVVGVPAHIVYRSGERVLITDPHDIKDPLSDALIALSERVEQLEARAGAAPCEDVPFATEEAERSAYRRELEFCGTTFRWARESEVANGQQVARRSFSHFYFGNCVISHPPPSARISCTVVANWRVWRSVKVR